MKNEEIIAKAAVEIGMYSEEEVKKILEDSDEIPLHTINGWNNIGKYFIRDGEEGITVRLWRRKADGKGFYKAKALLYKEEQLERVQ